MNRLLAKKWTSEWWAQCFLCILWGMLLLDYMRGIINHLPLLNNYTDEIETLVVTIPMICSIPYFIKRLKPLDYVFITVVALIYGLNFVIYTQNIPYLENHAYSFLCTVLPFYLVGRILELHKLETLFFYVSVIAILISAFYYLSYAQNLADIDTEEYNMSASYKLLPHVIMVLWITLKDSNLWKVCITIIGILLIIAFGTRGPLVCIIVYAAIYLFFIKPYKHRNLIRVVIVSMSIFIFKYMDMLMLFMQGILLKLNMSTRILDKYFEQELSISDGRYSIEHKLVSVMQTDGNIFGHGICSSWYYINTYPHNLLLDFVFSYGYIIGSILLCIFAGIVIIAIYRCRMTDNRDFILVLICCSIVKLFMSSTYLDDTLFFMLLGYCITQLNNSRCTKVH